MKQKIVLTALVLFLCHILSWGQKLSIQQQEQVIQKIASVSSSVKTIQCTFNQTKKMKMLKNEMKSSGVMFYKSPNKLRWQYKTPYPYIFVMNGNKVSVKSSNGTQNFDAQHSKMFRQISNIILGSVTGKNLRGAADFNIEIWKDNATYIAKLLPKKKELKSLYNYINVRFNSSLDRVESVEMSEKTGDMTIVNMINTETNHAISESVFTVN